jgi:hypothetical protein
MEQGFDVGGSGQAPKLGGRTGAGETVDLGGLGVCDGADEEGPPSFEPIQEAPAALGRMDQ